MTKSSRQEFLMRQARVEKIPSNWSIATVGQSCSVRNDLRKPISVEERKDMEGQYPYYGPTGVLSYINEYRLNGEYALIGEDGDHFLKHQYRPQTLLLKGSTNVNNHAHVVASTERCHVKWFARFFEHRNICQFLSRQGASRFKLNKETLLKLPILLPPVAEQKKIIEILEAWDDAIATTEKLITAKQKLKKALVSVFFNRDRNSPKARLVRIREVAQVNPRKAIDIRDDSSITFLGMADIAEGGGILQRHLKPYIQVKTGYTSFQENDILVAKITPCFENDKGAIATQLENGVGVGSTEFHVLRAKENVKPNFLYHLTLSYEFRGRGVSNMTGSAGQKRIPADFIRSYPVLLPSLEEQNKICNLLDAVDLEITKLTALNLQIKRQKTGLMQKLLTGEWSVKVKEAA